MYDQGCCCGPTFVQSLRFDVELHSRAGQDVDVQKYHIRRQNISVAMARSRARRYAKHNTALGYYLLCCGYVHYCTQSSAHSACGNSKVLR
jgi:hypothetical protein